MPDLLNFFTNRTENAVSLLEALMLLESPTPDKPLVDALGVYIQGLLEATGAAVIVYPRAEVGDIRLAKWNETASGKPILLLCHMDTVWAGGTLAQMPIRRDEYRLYGPGALDMKAGITIAIEAVRGLQAHGTFPNRPIWLLLTTDEETGSHHSRDLIIELAQQSGVVFVMEPATENEGLKTWRKGNASYWIKAVGRASHAGNAPEAGINAIIEIANQAIALNSLNLLRKGTSVSVTQISGGVGNNVIPPEAGCYADVRFLIQAEAERIDNAIRNLQPIVPGSQLEIIGEINRLPMERNDLMIKTFRQAQALAQQLGLALGEDGAGGVSDANLTAAAGIPTLDGLGGHGEGMHALHEHVLIRSLPRRAALLAILLREWQGG